MSKIKLEFSTDYNTVREVKYAAQILRDLLIKREQMPQIQTSHYPEPDDAIRFVEAFDSLTQNFGV